jgi:hypothetical protein
MGWFKNRRAQKRADKEWHDRFSKSILDIMNDRDAKGVDPYTGDPWPAPFYDPDPITLPPIEEEDEYEAVERWFTALVTEFIRNGTSWPDVKSDYTTTIEVAGGTRKLTCNGSNGVLLIPEEVAPESPLYTPPTATTPLTLRLPARLIPTVRIRCVLSWPPPDPTTLLSVLRLGYHPLSVVSTNMLAALDYHCAKRLESIWRS